MSMWALPGTSLPAPAQGLDVPLNRPAGYLKLLRQFRGRDRLPLEQDGQDSNEPLHCFQ